MSFDAGLQPERTSLAWRRTGLLGVVATLALVRAALVRGSLALAAMSGLLALVAAATLGHGIREHERSVEGPQPPVLPRAATVTVVVTSVVAAIGLTLVVFT